MIPLEQLIFECILIGFCSISIFSAVSYILYQERSSVSCEIPKNMIKVSTSLR